MSTFNPVTHVIFDLDGLLLDSETVYKSTHKKVIESFGKTYDPEIRLKVLGTKEQDTAETIVKCLGLPISPEEFSKMAKDELAKVYNNIPLKPGAKKLIEHLSYNKVPIAVATSSSEQSYHQKTAVHKELFSHMHHVVKGSTDPEVINGKPAPDIFRIAAARFPNPPPTSKCLAFEDAPNGVLSATSAGMQCVMVPEDYIPEELTKKATLVLKSLVDFKPEEFGLPPYN
ncbi:haloacid dehalogenase-like hydrolase [Nesidiocoris tenuis]|uniref:Haloacid dehalogenase-like hydrolase n=1 Tax=Nesidiocoris tenuis TaxID=355587 RepID=A0ABN7AUY0_9HEMI|nr:haloacid dehalogenase-like hydrolase [Nesidiocoris tenuis]